MQPAAKDLCWAPLRRDESSAQRVDRGQTDRSCHRHSCVPVSPTPTRPGACAAALPLGHIRFVSPYFCRGTEQGSSPCHMWFVCARHTWNSTFQTGIIANVLTTWQLPTPLRKQALAEPPLRSDQDYAVQGCPPGWTHPRAHLSASGRGSLGCSKPR